MSLKKICLMILLLSILMTGCGDKKNETKGDDFVYTTTRAENVGERELVQGKEMVLTLFDDFNNSVLNPEVWEDCPTWERSDRGGHWDPECSYTKDGKLVLETKYDSEAGYHISGAVRTKDKFTQTYGYFECSMRVQDVKGFWSAFWMMCGNVGSEENGAVDGVEIDIMEAHNVETKGINHALHWDGYGANHKSEGVSFEQNVYDGEFHTYSASWSPEGYKWYIDGELVWENNTVDVCDQPGYLKFTLEVGSWAGEINNEDLPATVEIDYLRVYQYPEFVK